MSKLVAIDLGEGNLRLGCPNVTVQITLENESHLGQFRGSLPADHKLEQLYKNWQLLYREFYREQNSRIRGIEIESGGVTQFSSVEFRHLSQQLEIQLNAWLNSESFQTLDRQLSRMLNPTEEIRLTIATNNGLLRRLPWHLWNFLEDYPQAEIALSTLEYRHIKPQSRTSSEVRILVILGNSDRLNTKADRQQLEALSGAKIQILESPQHKELIEHLWHPLGWDILFFAGHSQTEGEVGRIYLNQTDAITLEQLRNALKKAIARGLQLAIFNSCDGLGLAQSLADLHIPQVIVMRELVPDAIAIEFLRDFLTAFSGGSSLYTAVREAREKLEKLEGEYPYATWLPVICQNPTAVPATWQELTGSLTGDRRPISKQRLLFALFGSVVVTSIVMGMRQLGIFQQWELQTFDRLMQLRPEEKPDPRLLLITVTEKDVQNQNPQERRSSSLSDRTLAQLLAKIQPYQPRVIGLDIYRDFSVSSKYGDLKTYLQENKHFVGVCEVGETADDSGVRPPPEITSDRSSFSNIPEDFDGLIRRQLLGMAISPTSFCQTDTSFSFRLSQLYLASQGIESSRTSEGNLKIGKIIFKKLQPDTGGYHQLDTRGFQILLNYRSSYKVAEQITLAEILSDSINPKLPKLVKDRIVLIGTTAPSFKDYFPTPPTNSKWSQKLPGVIIQAHMTSQILSAVLDERPLVWWLPAWGETVWIWGWSVVGGGLGLYFRSFQRWGLASGFTFCTLYGVCFLFFLEGGWLPLVPAAIALIVTGGSIYVCYAKKDK